jgi:hypothetical protein
VGKDVTYVLPFERYPDLHHALTYYREARHLWHSTVLDEWNRQPLDIRKAAFERHERAVAAHRDLAERRNAGKLTQAEHQLQLREVTRDFLWTLPGPGQIDTLPLMDGSYRLRLRNPRPE